jgi:hypothetical protein
MVPALYRNSNRKGIAMCDYSLHHVQSRAAKVGDKLVSTKFINTPSGGFSASDNPNVAVCLLPGTEVAFEQDVETEAALGVLPNRKIGQRLARFRQVNLDKPCVHHDALEFADGKIVLVTRLRAGQRATVLQMPADPNVKHVNTETGVVTQAAAPVEDGGTTLTTVRELVEVNR